MEQREGTSNKFLADLVSRAMFFIFNPILSKSSLRPLIEEIAHGHSGLLLSSSFYFRASEVFGKLKAIFTRFIHFEDPVFYTFLAIFVVFTYLFNIFDEIPYVLIFGLPGSAKTLLSDILKRLCLNGSYSSDISAASIYMEIDQKKQITLIIDEGDDLGSGKRGDMLLRILLSGFRYDGNIKRRGKEFSTFAPKIIINVKGLQHSALDSRTIPIHMVEYEGDDLEEFRSKEIEGELKAIEGLISSFCIDYRDLVTDRYASFKGADGIKGRNKQVWGPLIVIADLLSSLLNTPSIKQNILDLARKTILERKRRQLIVNRDLQILIATREFIENTTPLTSEGLFIAEDLRDFIRASLDIPSLRTEAVARTLNRSNIIKESRRPKVDVKGEGGALKTVQKMAYIFNDDLLRKLTAKYF
jgi:hypothetical protein